MNYAIIAAGEGSRLRQEGFDNVKPLVKVCGEFLIERLIRIFKNNDAESISIIINAESEALNSYLNSKDWGVKINLIVKSTSSSLHSFWNIINQTNISEFCLTTVDTIFNERDFKSYISAFKSDQTIDALMGVTKYIDDEKPLYIQTDDNDNILAFCDNKEIPNIEKMTFQDNKMTLCSNKEPFYFSQKPIYLDKVSAGIYCLRKKAIVKTDECIKNGVERMRNYQRSLVEANLKVKAFLFSKVIDIDHVTDIEKAQKLLQQFDTKILCLKRFKDYSPNSQHKDEQIIKQVGQKLQEQGYWIEYKDEMEVDFNKNYYSYVISMARNPNVIKKLHIWEKKGSQIVNSPSSCENCYREKQIKIFQDNNINIPKTIIVKTMEDFNDFKSIEILDNLNNSGKEWWIKRGDFQTIEPIDVIKVDNIVKTKDVLNNYYFRQIKTAVISENINGDIVKFYGVIGTDFFYLTYPKKNKFGEDINISPNRIVFDKQSFIDMCQKAAKVLELDIYGGDAVVDKEGRFYIIDMNDFPSFSSCNEEASDNIVKEFLNKCHI